jgi:hypothetical protein
LVNRVEIDQSPDALDIIELVLVKHLGGAIDQVRIDEGTNAFLTLSGVVGDRRDIKFSGVVAIGHTDIIMMFVK